MNFIEHQVDVLAGSPTEINQITSRLTESGYTVVRSLGYVHPSINKSRRFQTTSYDGRLHTDSVVRVSAEFPESVFLLDYQDPQWSYAGKCVIHGGKVVRHIHDGDQQAQSEDWALLDIFAPFRAEYSNGIDVGSLWDQWVDDIVTAANGLKEQDSDAGLSVERFQDALNGEVKAVRALEKFLESDSESGPKQ